ncbi:helix-turn-helix domain-containing protein [Alicyclobacillus fodiniaquatilis]|uniref:Helix-turn-helix domain-containing protein n=1 Tax=Alicyclobacillus fodiniaquatilis TaxID=1661150 RepID=A0ABW4JEG5_9BACL
MEENCLSKVVTAIEASKMWGKDPTLFKKMCANGAFQPEHYTKAGREWLLLLSPLIQLYGTPIHTLDEVRNMKDAGN